MDPNNPTPPAAKAVCVPFAQTTARDRELAAAFLLAELKDHFPTLDAVPFTNALLDLQPNLWREGELVFLDYADLVHLTQRLATTPELPQLDPPIYPYQARYLAKRLVNYSQEAQRALADIEANPLAYGPAVVTLVLGLAAGNGIALEVYYATHRGAQPPPDQPDPAQAAVDERIDAIRRARGEGIHRLLKGLAANQPAEDPADA